MRFLLASLARRSAALLLVAAGMSQAYAACPPAPPTAEAVRAEAARQAPRDRGLLWRLEKDGRTSWLYGTMHVSRVEWAVPGPRIQRALANSDVLALELDPADPDLPRLFAAASDPQRGERVLAGLRPQVARLAEQGCLPGAQLASHLPLLQLMTLAIVDARREGLHPEVGVDNVLWELARLHGKRIVALETPAQQLAALVPEREADERELVEDGLRQLADGESRTLMLRLVRAWADGDAATLADYPRWCRCLDSEAEQRFEQALNGARNPGLADKVAALHDGGQRVFAAVGALHMTGPQAVTELLRRRGFAVRLVPFTTP